jgi:hypothetical protein
VIICLLLQNLFVALAVVEEEKAGNVGAPLICVIVAFIVWVSYFNGYTAKYHRWEDVTINITCPGGMYVVVDDEQGMMLDELVSPQISFKAPIVHIDYVEYRDAKGNGLSRRPR